MFVYSKSEENWPWWKQNGVMDLSKNINILLFVGRINCVHSAFQKMVLKKPISVPI